MLSQNSAHNSHSDHLIRCIGSQDLLAHFEEQESRGVGGYIKFIVNYVCLTSILFASLLIVSNFSAYKAIASDYLMPERLTQIQSTISSGILESNSIQPDSLQAIEDQEESQERKEQLAKLLEKHLEREKVAIKNDAFSVERFNNINSKVTLDFEIAPYENRIIIPKIGKNIPLVNVENHEVENSNEWHKIFMSELSKGVIKYPGSADPGEVGNSFIFGHSSNFPWAKGQYNEVFALLDKLENGDEIVTYHNQKKYTYRVLDKKVVKPGYVSALEANPDRKLMTLMTCWPIGTTLNRLLVIAELDEEDIDDTLVQAQGTFDSQNS